MPPKRAPPCNGWPRARSAATNWRAEAGLTRRYKSIDALRAAGIAIPPPGRHRLEQPLDLLRTDAIAAALPKTRACATGRRSKIRLVAGFEQLPLNCCGTRPHSAVCACAAGGRQTGGDRGRRRRVAARSHVYLSVTRASLSMGRASASGPGSARSPGSPRLRGCCADSGFGDVRPEGAQTTRWLPTATTAGQAQWPPAGGGRSCAGRPVRGAR